MSRARSARLLAVVALVVAGCGSASNGDLQRRIESLERKMRSVEDAAVEMTKLVDVVKNGVGQFADTIGRASDRVTELQDAVIRLEKRVAELER